MKSVLQGLLASIKAGTQKITTKLKMLFQPATYKNKASSAVRKELQRLLDIKPRDGKDYVPFFAWMISRRLAKMLILLTGILSAYYILFINPPSIFGGNGIRTYSYNSIPLKFAKGEVRIKAKSGYTAYEGNVSGGFVTGQGTLFRKSGEVVYTGKFRKNKYNGKGQLYYPGGQMKYEGVFSDNRFNGKGTLYRENGSREYEGSFAKGMKNGKGTLFDSGDNQVFTGSFSQDELLYSDLLGKTTKEISEVYTGERKIYTDGLDAFTVALEDIDAVYSGAQDGTALDDSMKVEGIYVLKNKILLKDKICTSVAELKELLGEPEYEGNSSVTLAEAVAISYLNEKEDCLFGPVNMDSEKEFSDVITINDYDPDYVIYLYSYTVDSVRYTFFTDKKNGEISMYLIEKE